MKFSTVFIILILFFTLSCYSFQSRYLNRRYLLGYWKISCKTMNSSISIWTYVNDSDQGIDVHSAFHQAGIWPNPLIDKNDFKLRKTFYSKCIFEYFLPLNISDHKNFPSLTELVLPYPQYKVCVQIDSKIIDCTRNTFKVYRYKLKYPFTNLRLIFDSTVKSAAQQAAIRRNRQPLPKPLCWPKEFHGFCHINLVRTVQASFGWDWGPAVPTYGLWEIPYLELMKDTGVKFGSGFKAFPLFNKQTNAWTLHLAQEITVLDESWMENNQIRVTLSFDPNLKMKSYIFIVRRENLNPNNDLNMLNVISENSDVKPWNPQHAVLYTVYLKLEVKSVDVQKRFKHEKWIVIDTADHPIGFRTIKRINKDIIDPNTGSLIARHFQFEINGESHFLKGSNWIPSSTQPGKKSPGFIDVLPSSKSMLNAQKMILDSAAKAGVQMLRIWGGGRYEHEEFYRHADRLGILIWHDMMFACSTYLSPGFTFNNQNNSWLSVEEEVRFHVRRLHSHSSLAIWATNNEIETYIDQLKTSGQITESEIKAYYQLFGKILREIVITEESLPVTNGSLVSSERDCLVSSPSNDNLDPTIYDPYPQDPRFGDVHYYQYFGDLWTEDSYPATKFTSEFGVQSLPNALAWQRSLSQPDDMENWNVFVPSSIFEHRQHQPGGLHYLFDPLMVVLEWPTWSNNTNSKDKFIIISYLTQLHQMMSLRAQITKLERSQCRLGGVNWTTSMIPSLPDGYGLSMGALYWQLNDIWSAPTWSTIDAAGEWKMAHYIVLKRRVFLPYCERERIVLDSYLSAHDVTPGEVTVTCHDLKSFNSKNITIKLPESSDPNRCPQRVIELTRENLERKCGLKNVKLLTFNAFNEFFQFSSDWCLLDRPNQMKNIWLPQSGRIDTSISLNSDSIDQYGNKWFHYTIILTAEVPELFVWIQINSVLNVETRFDDNGFHLLDQKSRSVDMDIRSEKILSKEIIERNLIIITLGQIYKNRK